MLHEWNECWISCYIYVYYIFPTKNKSSIHSLFGFFLKGGSRFTTRILFQNLRQALNLLENGDILHSWWHPEIRYIHQLRVVGSWNPIFTWFLAPSQLVYLMIYGALAPIPGSLSHYLQGFSTIQTVVGNGISEPSTSNVPIGSMHGMNLPTWIVDNWIGC